MHRQDLHGDEVFVVRPVFSDEECRRLIARAERTGFALPADGAAGPAEVVLQDPALVRDLFLRLAPVLPDLDGREPVGLAADIRLTRLATGQKHFVRPADAPEGEDGARPMLVLHVFLNDDFEGGETVVYLFDRLLFAPLQRGAALLHALHQTREDLTVRAGAKYVLESEVLYGKRGEAMTNSQLPNPNDQ